MSVQQALENPYVGPRAFREHEEFFGRDREARELADLLTAQRIVLLHAPSGAGKTSLIQAGLTPLLKAEEDFAPTPPIRVNTRAPKKRQVRNPYVYSAAYYLLGEKRRPKELVELTLTQVVEEAAAAAPERTPVLVLDQFEEILLIDPTDRKNQEGFFVELGEALVATGAWALLSMREEYIGGLDRYVRYIPGHLSATYRLDYLDHDAAKEAIQRPAVQRGVNVADAAAAHLVHKMATMEVPGRDQARKTVEAPYVYPYQLQVVCRKLWDSVCAEKETRGRFTSISLRDAKRHADIEGALMGYYADVVGTVATSTGASEAVIRHWFATDLVSPEGYRRQTLAGPLSDDADPVKILRELEDLYVIRSDKRQEATWYELSHDQLIDAVVNDNRRWETMTLERWQLDAREWDQSDDPALLLRGAALRAASASSSKGRTDTERRFLKASRQAEHLFGRTRALIFTSSAVIFVETLAIIVLGLALYTAHR